MEQLAHQQSYAEVLNAAPNGGTRATQAQRLNKNRPRVPECGCSPQPRS